MTRDERLAAIQEMDAVIAELTSKGVTDKELADAKVRYRSNFYSQLESGQGKAHLLSALALSTKRLADFFGLALFWIDGSGKDEPQNQKYRKHRQ